MQDQPKYGKMRAICITDEDFELGRLRFNALSLSPWAPFNKTITFGDQIDANDISKINKTQPNNALNIISYLFQSLFWHLVWASRGSSSIVTKLLLRRLNFRHFFGCFGTKIQFNTGYLCQSN